MVGSLVRCSALQHREKSFSKKKQLIIMPRIDAFDESIIDGPPLEVFKALLNEAAGVTHWWLPHWESKPRGEPPFDREGAVFDITVHSGKATAKFSGKITKIVEAKLIQLEFVGDFVGTGEWKFEPTDGKTRMQFRWNVRPARLSFRLLSPFIDMGKNHSHVMQKGFEALNSYLTKK